MYRNKQWNAQSYCVQMKCWHYKGFSAFMHCLMMHSNSNPNRKERIPQLDNMSNHFIDSKMFWLRMDEYEWMECSVALFGEKNQLYTLGFFSTKEKQNKIVRWMFNWTEKMCIAVQCACIESKMTSLNWNYRLFIESPEIERAFLYFDKIKNTCRGIHKGYGLNYTVWNR